MVPVIPQSIQEKQEQQTLLMSNNNIYNSHSYIRLKASINHIFTWSNRFQKIYAGILVTCVMLCLWLPLDNPYSLERLVSLFSEINGSSAMHNSSQPALPRRCSLPPTISVDNMSNYTYMNVLNICLCTAAMIFVVLVNQLWLHISYDYFKNSYRCFRMIVIGLAISSICNQLVSAFTCRSIDILYDFRFTSMITVQIIGFFVCLLFTFLLGIKYASLNHVYKL